MLADDDIKNLLSKHMDIHYQALKESDEEWQRFKSSITFNADASQPARPESYLRVPFKEALNLVSKRSVFLHKGIAFVPINQLQSIA